MTIAQTQLTNAQVSLFYDPTYMEVNTSHASEPYNIKQILEANGHAVTTFIGAGTDAWRNATQGADVLVIPSLEVAAVSLSAGALFFLKDFVSRGGTLVTTQSFDQPNTDLLNALFDTALNEGPGGPSNATAAVGGTTYSGAAAAIPNNLGPIEALQATSLPVFATSLYENASGRFDRRCLSVRQRSDRSGSAGTSIMRCRRPAPWTAAGTMSSIARSGSRTSSPTVSSSTAPMATTGSTWTRRPAPSI